MDVAAHADTMSDDEETKVEEILTMILTTNASTVRNLVKLERTRICPTILNGLYYNTSSSEYRGRRYERLKRIARILCMRSAREANTSNIFRCTTSFILSNLIVQASQIKDQMHVRAPSSQMLCEGADVS